jgi:hypothetical protein
MTEAPEVEDDVKILPPDKSLQKKLGNVDLDVHLSTSVVAKAQEIIERSSDAFLDEGTEEAKKLELLAFDLRKVPDNAQNILHQIGGLSFSIKAKTGLGGYDLVATIAKSLQLFCERHEGESVTARDREIIEWHIESLKRLLDLKIKGSCGEVGEAILAELKKTSGIVA